MKEATSPAGETEGLTEKLRREILDIENHPTLSEDGKATRIIHVTCAVCAGVAIQPIPFADIFILTPIQGVMAWKLATIRGVPVRENEGTEVVRQLAGLVGMGVLAQQFAIGLYKTVLPFLGAVTTIPLVYGLTYAIGQAADFYFREKAAGRPIDEARIKEVWKNAKKRGEAEGKEREKEIRTAEAERKAKSPAGVKKGKASKPRSQTAPSPGKKRRKKKSGQKPPESAG